MSSILSKNYKVYMLIIGTIAFYIKKNDQAHIVLTLNMYDINWM